MVLLRHGKPGLLLHSVEITTIAIVHWHHVIVHHSVSRIAGHSLHFGPGGSGSS